MTTLDGAHVLVTGGSSGIGLATARAVLARGARVSIVARNAARLADAAHELEATAGDPTRVAVQPATVTDPEALESALTLLTAQLGPVDVLVTCAGDVHPGLFEELPRRAFVAEMDLDYFGTLNAVRAVVPSMTDRRRGHLVLVSSAAAIVPVYGYSAYCPAKFAVRGLAEVLRAELKPHGIAVSCAYPPDTETPGLAREREQRPRATSEFAAWSKARSPDSVATAIVRGIERSRFVVTADRWTALLARAGGLLGPIVRSTMDRHVRRAADAPRRDRAP